MRLSCYWPAFKIIILTHSHGIFKWRQLLPSLQGPAAGPMSPPYHPFNSEDFSYPSWVTLGVRVLGSFISQFFEMQMKILVRLAKRLFHLEVRVGDFMRHMLAGIPVPRKVRSG